MRPILVSPCDWRSSLVAGLPIWPASGIPAGHAAEDLDPWLEMGLTLRNDCQAAAGV